MGVTPASSPDGLVAAWLRWDQAPASTLHANARVDAALAVGYDLCQLHEHVAGHRRAGMSVPDAIQTYANGFT